jgi:hypothetical protein
VFIVDQARLEEVPNPIESDVVEVAAPISDRRVVVA